jgi:hypothetical protein
MAPCGRLSRHIRPSSCALSPHASSLRLPVPAASPISSSIQNAGDHVSPAFNRDHASRRHAQAGTSELKFLARFVDRATTRGDPNEAYHPGSGYGARAARRGLRPEQYGDARHVDAWGQQWRPLSWRQCDGWNRASWQQRLETSLAPQASSLASQTSPALAVRKNPSASTSAFGAVITDSRWTPSSANQRYDLAKRETQLNKMADTLVVRARYTNGIIKR